jgi:DNA-binding response OmpR family regulator
VDTHILTLRHKIEGDPGNPRHILTCYGEGYKFVD